MVAITNTQFDKQAAIKSLDFNNANTRLLNVLIETEQDFEMLQDFYKKARHDKEFTATSKLREYKIDNSQISLDEFVEMYAESPINALQRLFWDDVIQEDVDKNVNEYFANGHTLEDLYNAQQKKPYITLLKHLKSS
jgi:hypothetical protein